MTKIKIILAIVIATLVLSSCDNERQLRNELIIERDSLKQVISSIDMQIYAYPLIVYAVNISDEVTVVDKNGKVFILVTEDKYMPSDTLK